MNSLLLQKIEEYKKDYNKKTGKRDELVSSIEESKKKIDKYKNANKEEDQLIEIFKKVSKDAKKKVTKVLEDTCTKALQSVTGDDTISFEIDLDETKARPLCKFYVVEFTKGKINKQDPKEACGGSYCDILSAILRYSYIQLISYPKVDNGVLFDEPGKMLSAVLGVKFANDLKDLGAIFGRQNIIVSHDENIINVADNSIYVTKTNGVSKAYKGSELFKDEDNEG